MKGFMKDDQFHPIKSYKKGVRKSRDQSTKVEGIKIERKARQKEMTLESVLEKTEKEFEKSLKEHDFNNPNLRGKDWEVGITYGGGFSEEHFSFSAQIMGTDKSFTNTSWISNFDWSEGMDEKIQKRLENDNKFAQKEYEKWLVGSFELSSDSFFMELVDEIEEEA